MQMRNQRLFGSWRLRLPPRLRRIAVRAGIAVVIAVVGLVVTPATPAHASWYQCVKTEFCMWSDINDSGFGVALRQATHKADPKFAEKLAEARRQMQMAG